MGKFEINPKITTEKLTRFIKETVRAKGFKKVIVGLSGGLDSGVVAYLSKTALGKKGVIGVIMPYGKTQADSVKDAKLIAKKLGIKTQYMDIKPMIDAYFKNAKGADRLRRGNKMARERMSVLYDLSKKYNALVIGTSNKTERLLGYGTLHGDMACALNPIGGLYKTQVRTLGKWLGIAKDIVEKVPTAGLWPGQTDESELGYLYRDIDRLLFFMVDKRVSEKELIRKGFGKKFIFSIRKRIKTNCFKLQAPPIANR